MAEATRSSPDVSVPGIAVEHGDEVRLGVRAGQVLANRYRIVRLLGRGGAGEVYEAIDEHIGTEVALKVLHGVADDAHIERLRTELLLARKVSHPSVCRVFDLGVHEGPERIWFITMELLAGESLRDALRRRGPMSFDEARGTLEQLVAGLAVAHAAGVVHRDLTPSNIILVQERVVITDFGLAEGGGHDSPHARTAGTPAYMAPEQVVGQEATAATDVFALGVVMFEALTGELPWRGRTAYETAALRLTAPALRLRALLPSAPPGWDQALARCMDREPARRFAAVGDIATALTVRPRRVARYGVFAAVAVGAVVAGVVTTRDGGVTAAPLPPVSPSGTGPIALAFAIGGGAVNVEGIVELPDGDLLVAGHTFGPWIPRGIAIGECRVGDRCGFVARMSPAAELRWARALEGDALVRTRAPVVIGDRVLLAGDLFGAASFAGEPAGAYPRDGYVLELALGDGATRWFRRLGAPIHVRGIAVDPTGSIFLSGDAGVRAVWNGGWQVDPDRADGTVTGVVMALERDGATRWVRTLEGRRVARMFAVSASDAGVVWGGAIHSASFKGALVMHLDGRSGTVRWTREIANERAHVLAAAEPGDGSVVIAGNFEGVLKVGAATVTSVREVDGFAARLSLTNGEPLWLTPIGGKGFDNAVAIAADPRGVWVGGRTQYGLEPSGRQPIHQGGGADGYIVRLDPNGAILRTWLVGGSRHDKVRTLTLGRTGVWAGGNFTNAMTAGEFALVGDGINDGFVLRLANE